MLEVTQAQVIAALQALDIRTGDNLLVHSAVQFLGRPVGGIGMYLQAIRAVIGPHGTLAVPAFNFAFARGERYDPQNTPSSEMGVFSEYVRQQPGARRTRHPLSSLALLGPLAGELAGLDTPGAYDPGSAFERLLELDFKLLLLGASVQAVSIVHYSEQRRGVPYRFWKEFHGLVRTSQGWEPRSCRMFARDLQVDPQLDLHPIEERLREQGLWRESLLNYGVLAVCRLADFVAAADELLAEDPWALVANCPQETPPEERIRP
jgi:aminoglycoside 3-N-acetyltransferase